MLFPDNKLDVKTNVQSPGDIEFISHIVKDGLYLFGLISAGGIALMGGKFSFMGQTFETPGIMSYKAKKRSEQIANDREQLELIKEAARVSKELQVPISALGIEVPDKLENALESAVSSTPNDSHDDDNEHN